MDDDLTKKEYQSLLCESKSELELLMQLAGSMMGVSILRGRSKRDQALMIRKTKEIVKEIKRVKSKMDFYSAKLE